MGRFGYGTEDRASSCALASGAPIDIRRLTCTFGQPLSLSMRLLNVFNLRLEQFFEDQIPHYAILSHTWEDEEVTFQDMQKGHGPSRKGWQKIESCCKLVREIGNQEYVWIDTCCIDKSSSSELTESINSMFDWYARSEICYAYLKDVPYVRHDRLFHNEFYDLDLPFPKSFDLNFAAAFRRSRWFTRGWTLQELLTPEFVVFLNSGWTAITTKQLSVQIIQEVTGIEPQYLRGPLKRFSRATIARKMCWASGRQTTRKRGPCIFFAGLVRYQHATAVRRRRECFSEAST